MNVIIRPGTASGSVQAPPSKSYAHRFLICAALSEETSVIKGVANSQDMLATLDCMAALGVSYRVSGDEVRVIGEKRECANGAVFPCRESGSALRFFIPIALAHCSKAVFTGAESLISRGISVYEDLFCERGIAVEKTDSSITLSGELTPGVYEMRGNVSSQFASGLLFSLPLLSGDSILRVTPPVESRPYIDITLDAVKRFGITVEERDENEFFIPGNQRYLAANETVEGDWSNAASIAAFGAIGGSVNVTGLNPQSRQGDRVCLSLFERLKEPQPVIDLSDCPDLGPILFATAAALHGAVFTGTKRFKIKESDRASAMAEELMKFGIKTDVEDNLVRVYPGTLSKPTQLLQSHNDHRIVMALALLCSCVGGEIAQAEAINKTYPNYFNVLSDLGLEVVCGA